MEDKPNPEKQGAENVEVSEGFAEEVKEEVKPEAGEKPAEEVTVAEAVTEVAAEPAADATAVKSTEEEMGEVAVENTPKDDLVLADGGKSVVGGKGANKGMLIGLIVVLLLAIGAAVTVYALKDQLFKAEANKTTNSEPEATKPAEKVVDLAVTEEDGDVNITEGGIYSISGKVAGSVLIDSADEVTLRLNGLTVNAATTAAIANIGTGTLVIEIMDGTENVLTDGGASDYDGCIYSESGLTINSESEDGDGVLRVYGRQTEGEGIASDSSDLTINGGKIYIESADDGLNAGGDGGTITINGGDIQIKAGGDGIDSNKNAVFNGGTVLVAGSSTGGNGGIDTDAGYVINGGLVVAMGSDMLEAPSDDSKQMSVAMLLETSVAQGSTVELVDNSGKTIISFGALDSFRTLVLSSEYLVKGDYGLKVNGTVVAVNGATVFTLDGTVTKIGEILDGEMMPIGPGTERR